MAITRTAMIDDDGSGTTGTILNNAWKQELYGQIDAFGGGIWTTVPFNAANFTAAAGAWVMAPGHQAVFQWTVVNQKTVIVVFTFQGAMQISASTVALYVALPDPIPGTAIGTISTPMSYLIAPSTAGTGVVEVQTDRKLRLLRDVAGTPFPVVTVGNSFLYGQILYNIP